MPQENKKRGRGRRGEEKQKKEKVLDVLRAKTEDEARPAKRQRLSPPAEQALDFGDIRLDQGEPTYDEEGDNNILGIDGPQEEARHDDDRPEAQFFGLLEESEAAYFKRADLMLENDSFASPEERELFLDSVWNEARGKELKIACSQSCSRVLERLLKGSTSRQLKTAWSRLQGNFLALVQHRFASHCVEALFMAAASVISQEMLADESVQDEKDKNEFEDEESQAIAKPAEEFFLDTVKEFRDNLGFLITNSFASHTIRVLLLVLSGKPLAGSKSLLQSKKKEKVYAAGKQDPAMLESRTVPESFSKAASDMIRDTIVGLDTNYLRALATNQLANPVLQLFLELEFSGTGKQKAKDDKSLFRRLLPDDPPSEGTQSASFVKGLLYDPIGSRLLETVVQHAPGKTFKTIYKVLFKDNIGSIVKNEVAGFVIVKILQRLSQEELQSAAEQILPQTSLLFERSKHSIIRCLIERCRVRGVATGPIAAAMTKAFEGSGQAMLEKFLQPNANVSDSMSAERKVQIEQNNSNKIHASLLAQAMLSQEDDVQQLILDSLIACDQDFLVSLSQDRTATHVLQAALKPQIPKHVRKQLVQKLQPRVAELALDSVGSHVVDALSGATTGLHFLRERAADALSKNEAEIKDSFSGRQVWRNWLMDLYQRRRADWIARVKEQDQADAVEETQPEVANQTKGKFKGRKAKEKPLTGIEAARARFIAQKKHGGTGANAVAREGRRLHGMNQQEASD